MLLLVLQFWNELYFVRTADSLDCHLGEFIDKLDTSNKELRPVKELNVQSLW